jgi:hypothetical protein
VLEQVRSTISEYWTPAAITAAVAALARYLKPRRLISFFAAVKERETMIAQAEYWKAETDREKESGLRWKAHYDECVQTLSEADALNATLDGQLRASRRRSGNSGP